MSSTDTPGSTSPLPAGGDARPTTSPVDKDAGATMPAGKDAGATPARRRGLFFWLSIASFILLGLPVLLYLGALAYVKLGFANGSIAESINLSVDGSASVGGVNTRWLKNLSVERITLQARDQSTPFSADSLTLDWDLGAFLGSGQIRSAKLEHPALRLRRNAAGEWNLRLKPPTTAAAYRIAQAGFDNGELQVELDSGTPGLDPTLFRLQSLAGTFGDNGALAPSPFALQGELPSGERFSLSGTSGPGAVWQARASAGLRLERDFGGMLPRGFGRLQIELSAQQAGAASEAMAFNGRIGFDGAQWRFAERRLDVPASALLFEGQARAGADEKLAFAVPEKLTLRVDGLGILGGPLDVTRLPARQANWHAVDGALSIDGINNLFQPRLWGGLAAIEGRLDVSNFVLNIPLDAKAPTLAWTADLKSSDLRFSFRGLGRLPIESAAARWEWPGIQNIRLRAHDGLGETDASIADLSPAGEDFLVAFLQGVKVHSLNLDIARFWDSEMGRRVLSGALDANRPAPVAADLLFGLKGQVRGTDMSFVQAPPPHPTLSPRGRGETTATPAATRMELRGLAVRDAGISKWPLPFHPPGHKLSGGIQIAADVKDSAVRALTVQGKLKAAPLPPANGSSNGVVARASSPADPSQDVAEIEFSQTFTPQGEPGAKIGPVAISRLRLPLADVENIFNLRQAAGVSGTGMLEVRDMTVAMSTGEIAGTVHLDEAVLRAELPEKVQALMLRALKVSGYSVNGVRVASLLEQVPVQALLLQGLSGEMAFKFKGSRLTLSGRTRPFQVAAVATVPWGEHEKTAVQIPAAAVTLGFDLDAAGHIQACSANLDFESGDRVALNLRRAVKDKDEVWQAECRLDSKLAGGLNVDLSCAYNATQSQVGATVFKVRQIDIDKLSRLLPGLPKLTGLAKNLRLDLEGAALNKGVTAQFGVDLHEAGLAAAPALELDLLTGHANGVLGVAGDSLRFNALLRLESYRALLGGGALYVPPPLAGRVGFVKLVGKSSYSESGGRNTQLDVLDVNLGELVKLEASGTLTSPAGLSRLSLNLPQLKIASPDLAEAMKSFGPPNLKDRTPWFGDLKLAGSAEFKGKFAWEGPGSAALKGKLAVAEGEVSAGREGGFMLRGLSGEIPLNLRTGLARTDSEELEGSLTFRSLTLPAGIGAAGQEIKLVAEPNTLTVKTDCNLATPGGGVSVKNVKVSNLLPESAGVSLVQRRDSGGAGVPALQSGESGDACAIDFSLAGDIDVRRALNACGIALQGIDDCVLKGVPLACRLKRTDGLRGPWELSARGAMRAPFFGGELVVENAGARGLFGPAPVFGCDARLAGVHFAKLTEQNPRFGKIALPANVSLNGLELAAGGWEGVQAFTLDVDSLSGAGAGGRDQTYDGMLALNLNYALVRAAFPAWGFSDSEIRKLSFGVRQVGLRYELREGLLRGPRPKLPGGYILLAGDAGQGTGPGRFNIQGDADARTPWTNILRHLNLKK